MALGLNIQLKNNLNLASCPLLLIRAGWFCTEDQLLFSEPGVLLPFFSSSSSSKNSGKENASLSCSISSCSVSNFSPERAFRTAFTWLEAAQPKRESINPSNRMEKAGQGSKPVGVRRVTCEKLETCRN